MKNNKFGLRCHRKHFLIHLALEAVTLVAAVATLHEIDKVRRAVRRVERR